MIGYITPITGLTDLLRDWLLEHNAKYSRDWGWYFEGEAPSNLPIGLETHEAIHWEELNQDTATGEFIGTLGGRISVPLKCSAVYKVSNSNKKCYYFTDNNDRKYIWFTTPRDIEPGINYYVTGTIKKWQVYRGEKQTVLTRCVVKPKGEENESDDI